MRKSILIILLFMAFLQFINADTISINSGGNEEIVLQSLSNL